MHEERAGDRRVGRRGNRTRRQRSNRSRKTETETHGGRNGGEAADVAEVNGDRLEALGADRLAAQQDRRDRLGQHQVQQVLGLLLLRHVLLRALRHLQLEIVRVLLHSREHIVHHVRVAAAALANRCTQFVNFMWRSAL